MKIFLTGSAGFVGFHLANYLTGLGHEIICHCRPHKASQKRLIGHHISWCDLSDQDMLKNVIHGVDAVIHCAAFVSPWGKEDDFFLNNVVATKNLVDLAKTAGVYRFIYLSCASVVMQDRKALINIAESLPYSNQPGMPYSNSKAIAEKYVLGASTPEFKTIALRPAFIWGRGDIVDRQIGEASKKGKFGWFNQGDYLFSTCYIDNLKEAISKALETDIHGEAFFISDGEPMVYRSFMSKRLAIDAYPIPTLSITNQFAWALAKFTENGWKYLPMKGSPPITREMVRLTGYPFTVSLNKSSELLGYQPKYSMDQAFLQLTRVTT
jgi:nucleoside-diphosphate-sugar epimerase